MLSFHPLVTQSHQKVKQAFMPALQNDSIYSLTQLHSGGNPLISKTYEEIFLHEEFPS